MRPLTLLVLCCLTCCVLPGQITVSGNQLTVVTGNATARFAGPDLVSFTNTLTGESYLRLPSSVPLADLEVPGGTGQGLTAPGWAVAQNQATLTLRDSRRALTLTVEVDAGPQEIVVRVAGQTTTPGVTRAWWSIAGLDLKSARLVVPANTGVVFDERHPGNGASFRYPHDWQAQMAVLDSGLGSALIYSTDGAFRFKQIRLSSRMTGTVDVALGVEAGAPYANASNIPAVEWRMKAFAGDWRVAAGAYRDWLAANRPHLPESGHAWTRNIRAVAQVDSLDVSLLEALAARLTPSATLLYLPNWRNAGYDAAYPDYTPAPGAAGFIAAAHKLGFRVMLHTNMVGISPSDAEFGTVRRHQLRDPATRELQGWLWEEPAGTPDRFAFINPASSAWRSLFIARIRQAIDALRPDALHLDVSAPMFSDGNGLIEGMTYPQGAARLHQDLRDAFPGVALGGEGMNDVIARYNSFAQTWWTGPAAAPAIAGNPVGHPVLNFLWNSLASSRVLYYGHLGQPRPGDRTFVDFVAQVERRGILPKVPVSDVEDLDLGNGDVARLVRWVAAWQAKAFEPAWAADWNGASVRYAGAGGAAGALTDTGSLIRLDAEGPVYQRVHGSAAVETTGFIPNWPAFDATRIFGLDTASQYWLDAIPRPVSTHVAGLPAAVRLGADTMVARDFAFVEVAPEPLFDFVGELGVSKVGITEKGADQPLGHGGSAEVVSSTAGGVTRAGIFLHPPYENGREGGESFVEWPVAIGEAATFSFAAGVQDGAQGCSDGVTFRVFVNGVESWQRFVVPGQGWVDGSVDLAAGKSARIRIATHPGPAVDTGCDWASFSSLTLVPRAVAPIAVPVVLRPEAAIASSTGDGSVQAGPSGVATVSGVPVPGRFLLFLADGSVVGDGTALAGLPFEKWSGANGQLATPGTVFGAGDVLRGVSDGQARPGAIYAHPPNEGRTVLSWTLAIPSEGAYRVGWSAGLQDGASTGGVRFSVHVNGRAYWSLAKAEADGWTAGLLDLANWRGQRILFQLVTDSAGDNNSDWAWWADVRVSRVGEPCAVGVPGEVAVPGVGGQVSVNVSAAQGCSWMASTDVSWISVERGMGQVRMSVLPNAGPARKGGVRVGGRTIEVTQAGGVDPLAPSFVVEGMVVAPGSIAQIRGSGLFASAAGVLSAGTIPLPRELGGVAVRVNGVPAPLFSAAGSDGGEQEVTLQIPWEVEGQQFATIVASSGGRVSSPVVAPVVSAAPRIFPPVFETAVLPGETIVFYAAGLGAVTPAVPTGDGAPVSPLSNAVLPLAVTIAGLPAKVLFAGLAPGLVGLYQVVVEVPGDVGGGEQTVVLTSAGQGSAAVVVSVGER